jgi:hypothetical protein
VVDENQASCQPLEKHNYYVLITVC